MAQPTTAARPRRRRWFRYSLRTLIVCVTLAAIGMAWVVREREQSRRELEVARELEASGAIVELGGRFDVPRTFLRPPSQHVEEQAWWRTALGGILGPRVRVVLGTNTTDLVTLDRLENLQELSVGGRHISDLSPLAGFKNLRSLVIYYGIFSDLRAACGTQELGRASSQGHTSNRPFAAGRP